MRPAALTLLALAALSRVATAQAESADELTTLTARVTSIGADSVFLDVGHKAGAEPGDQVRLQPLGDVVVHGEVAAVSATSCRVDLSGEDAKRLSVGDGAEVFVPTQRLRSEGAAPTDDIPEHPPWSHPPEDWDTQQPLLASARATPAEERPLEIRGRLFTQLNVTDDRVPSDRRFSLWRVGAEAFVENPFDRGGQLHVDGEVFRRETSVSGLDDDVDQRGRLDRLSYSVGGTREDPLRVEFGRFLQHEFPELGLLDGAEITRRLDDGDRIGFSAGFLPVPRKDLSSGDDAQVAFTWRADGGGEDDVAVGLAVAATWHDGEADRQLVIGTAEWTPHETLGVFGTAWVDWYDSDDVVKDSGAELTEVRLSGRWRHPDNDVGVGLHASRVRFPELLRNEFDPLTAAELLDKRTDRFGVSAWRQLTQAVRVDGRVDQWSDEERDGSSADVRVTLRNLLWERGRVFVQVFTRSGDDTDGTGLRVGGSRSFEGGSFSLTAEQAGFDLKAPSGLTGGNDTTSETQRVLRANLDLQVSAQTALSLWAEERFGDLDATTLGALWQRRF